MTPRKTWLIVSAATGRREVFALTWIGYASHWKLADEC